MKEPLEGNFGLIKPFENQGGEDLTDARNDSEMLSPGEKADVLQSQLALRGLDPYNSAHVMTTADELGADYRVVGALKGRRIKRCSE